MGGARNFFFFMVSEQVNLNRERRPYGKIEKSTKSLHPSTYVPYTMKQVRFNFFVLGLVGMLDWLSLPLVENVMVYTLFLNILYYSKLCFSL